MLRTLGLVLLAITAVAVLGAPVLAPHPGDASFPASLNAPPTIPRIRDSDGWHMPFIYRSILVNQLEQRYQQDRAARIPIAWFRSGRLVQSSDERGAPLLLLGADSFGRDVFSRLLFGGRTSLGLALAATLGALVIGASIGAIAGYVGGAVDDVLRRASDFVLVLPAMYVALALRSVLPLVLEARVVFILLAGIFAIVGAPFFARGVRAIIRSERRQDYAIAAASLGASDVRVLARHLLPATRGFMVVQITLLVPAFIIAEATLSYVGLGFPDPTASWGTMLHDASNVRVFADFPWLLSPAAAMFLIVLALNLVMERADADTSAGLRASRGYTDVKSVAGVQSTQ
jgi:peptide/nickel transport system permease protein